MTTEKLIEIAQICCTGCDEDCPYRVGDVVDCMTVLLDDVTDRLEKVYTELKKQCPCESCEYFADCDEIGYDAICCSSGNIWEQDDDEE